MKNSKLFKKSTLVLAVGLPLLLVAFIMGSCSQKTYKVGGKGPAGGFVFYDKGNEIDGWRYLEAAPASKEFKSSNIDDAFDLCDKLQIKGIAGWRIPDKEELEWMYKNLKQKNIGGFKNEVYLSGNVVSFLNGQRGAETQDFASGKNDYFANGTKEHLVRPIRKF